MMRFVFWFVLLATVLTVSLTASLAGEGQTPQKLPAAPPSAALSPDQARALLDLLNDPKKRAAFSTTLEALVKGRQLTEAPPTPSPPEPAPEAPKPAPETIPIQFAPDSLGAQLLLTVSSFVNEISADMMDAFRTVQSLPLLWAWAVVMLTNPMGQRLLLQTGSHLAIALTLAGLMYGVIRYLLRRPMARFRARADIRGEADLADAVARAEQGEVEPPSWRQDVKAFGPRARLGFWRFALEIAPVVGLLLVSHFVAGSALGGPEGSRLVILAVSDAIAVCLILLALKTLLFKPEPEGARLILMPPPLADYLTIWTRRLILIGIPGYTTVEVGLLLGLSTPAHDALQKTVGLALIVCLAIIVLERRRGVRRWLSARPGKTGVFAILRTRLAKRWHWIALFFLAASWLSWTLRAPDAIARGLGYFATTGLVIVAAGFARMVVSVLIGRVRPSDLEGPEHTFRVRLAFYRPILARLIGVGINLIAVLALLQLYGLGGLTWLLASDVGHRVASGIATLAVTIGLAFAVWEIANIAIQRHLETLRREAQAVRSARIRTLLPLMRTALSIAIVIVAGLMVLSEIGVNIAPLLAGAGIIGVAIGFGSQKLVQDVITGVFLLLENTMQVGDVVRVGEQSGLVESLSVRTIRLRTEDGSVVVIPFSAVTTVTNMTRDFSRAVISVSIGTNEDVDRVIETMRGIARDMRQEEAWSAIILDDLEVWGLDKFTDSALLIKCRIMCTPFGRWPVGREFNRRMKAEFEAVGIEMPYPHLKLVMDTPAMAPAPGATMTLTG